MSAHTIALTGANRGIGLELARLFRERGDAVIALCRHGEPRLEEIGAEVIEGVEVTSRAALADAAGRLGERRIHVLVNVAGILEHDAFDRLDDAETLERIRQQFEVNALAPLQVTRAFADQLAPRAKVALITSRMGSIGDNDSGNAYGYRMSKAALNAGGKSLALDLAARNVAVGIFHPGFVRTAMTGYNGNVEASEAAAMLLERIDELNRDNAGRFLHANGEELPW
jgi:NAD(P)-dependent dehydrogenase (short-subunit alcohol dehydrogenase family)